MGLMNMIGNRLHMPWQPRPTQWQDDLSLQSPDSPWFTPQDVGVRPAPTGPTFGDKLYNVGATLGAMDGIQPVVQSPRPPYDPYRKRY